MYTPTELELIEFIQTHVSDIAIKYKNTCLGYFTATTSGKDADYKAYADYNFEREKTYANRDDFKKIANFIDSQDIHDPLLKRQLDMLFLSYQSKQVNESQLKAIISLQNIVESTFATFRPNIHGKQVSDNDIKTILTSSTQSNEVKEAWLASKEIGSLIAPDVIKLVKMRNTIAHELGYKNYHSMSLQLDEQDPEEISRVFNELDILTRDAFIKEKKDIDSYLAHKFSISQEELLPRHYQGTFFQEAPRISPIALDTYYTDKDIVELSKTYYNSIGLNVDSILANSDLYERPGKYQHAYCTHIDKMGDVRILCNIKPTIQWMGTQLHELGHAVYDKYLDYTTPYLLRDPAHTFTTEAIAMMFGRFSSNPQWIQDMLGINDQEKHTIAATCFATLRREQLIFSRWAQVVYHFEKNMYEDPDQNLNILWRDIVEKYQMIHRPIDRDEADWAAKIHISCYPCYYHNYLLGELLASQIYYYIVENILKSSEYQFQSFYRSPEVGTYLQEKIFALGRSYHWNAMIEKATGEKLTPKYYAQQFVQY